MQTGVATHPVELNERMTFFTRFGWLFPWFTIVISIALLAHATIRAMRR